ncbi:MAG: hypothetical protein IT285_14115 [Bdellovibrionales bacterium]|nr:hypothetical protein [Bdellovibrionales bacterium]
MLIWLVLIADPASARTAPELIPTRLKCGEYSFRGRLRSSADGKATLQLQGAPNTKRIGLELSGLTPDELARHAGQFVEVRARVDSEAPPEKVQASVTRVVGIVPRAKAQERPAQFVRKVSCLPPRPSARTPAPIQKPKKSVSSAR